MCKGSSTLRVFPCLCHTAGEGAAWWGSPLHRHGGAQGKECSALLKVAFKVTVGSSTSWAVIRERNTHRGGFGGPTLHVRSHSPRPFIPGT